jgi:phage gp16-like protein
MTIYSSGRSVGKSLTTVNRKRFITLIHVAKKDLGLDEDTYRAVIEQTTGQQSLKELSIDQLNAVLNRLKASGFTVKPKDQSLKQADDGQSRMIRHLWLLLHNAGEVRNPSELALAKYVEKQVRVSALQFLSTDKASKVIERLKQWCDRKDIPHPRPVDDIPVDLLKLLNKEA